MLRDGEQRDDRQRIDRKWTKSEQRFESNEPRITAMPHIKTNHLFYVTVYLNDEITTRLPVQSFLISPKLIRLQ